MTMNFSSSKFHSGFWKAKGQLAKQKMAFVFPGYNHSHVSSLKSCAETLAKRNASQHGASKVILGSLQRPLKHTSVMC